MNERKCLKLQAALPKIEGFDEDCNEALVTPHSFVRDGALHVSAENGDGAADYYGEYRGNFPYIHPTLEAWATKHKGYWEWVNPGCIAFYAD